MAHYSPSAGYFPLPGWAGFAVLLGYTLILVMAARARSTGSAPVDAPKPSTPRAPSPI